eukprot:9304869-Pyramimonas_sp.AAC.1
MACLPTATAASASRLCEKAASDDDKALPQPQHAGRMFLICHSADNGRGKRPHILTRLLSSAMSLRPPSGFPNVTSLV